MSWKDAAGAADKQAPPTAPDGRVPLADARTARAEALRAIEELVPMLDEAGALMQRRWPMEASDWNPSHLMPGPGMSSKSVVDAGQQPVRGVLFSHGGGWQLRDPVLPVHLRLFAQGGGDGRAWLADDKRDPDALAALAAACAAAKEWVPVELVLTLRSQGLPLPE